jgi:hypothetical protein
MSRRCAGEFWHSAGASLRPLPVAKTGQWKAIAGIVLMAIVDLPRV